MIDRRGKKKKKTQMCKWKREIVMSQVDWGGEQNTLYKGVKTFP